MPSTKTRTVSPKRLQSLVHNDLLCVALAALVALGVHMALPPTPPTFGEITVTNPTDYDIAIQVRGSSGGWMALSTVGRHSVATIHDVIDQGDSWTFRLTAQGRSGGDHRLERDELEASGWNFDIEPGVELILRDAGAAPPP